METPCAGVYLKSVLGDIVIVSVQQKVDILTGVGQFPSVIASDSSCSNDAVPHVYLFFIMSFPCLIFIVVKYVLRGCIFEAE